MAQVLRELVAVCIAERVFDLLVPSGNLKKQLKTVSGIVMTALFVKIITEVFGR